MLLFRLFLRPAQKSLFAGSSVNFGKKHVWPKNWILILDKWGFMDLDDSVFIMEKLLKKDVWLNLSLLREPIKNKKPVENSTHGLKWLIMA